MISSCNLIVFCCVMALVCMDDVGVDGVGMIDGMMIGLGGDVFSTDFGTIGGDDAGTIGIIGDVGMTIMGD